VLKKAVQQTEGRFWNKIENKFKKNLRFSFETIKREFMELMINIIVPYLTKE
jgi:hypothetical protein